MLTTKIRTGATLCLQSCCYSLTLTKRMATSIGFESRTGGSRSDGCMPSISSLSATEPSYWTRPRYLSNAKKSCKFNLLRVRTLKKLRKIVFLRNNAMNRHKIIK